MISDILKKLIFSTSNRCQLSQPQSLAHFPDILMLVLIKNQLE